MGTKVPKRSSSGLTCNQSANTRNLSCVGMDLPGSQLRAVFGVMLFPQYCRLNSPATKAGECRMPMPMPMPMLLRACFSRSANAVVSIYWQGPTASTSSFPQQSAYKTLVANGLSKNFTISGACTGTETRSSSPANTAVTFEGTAGFSAASTITVNYTNCTPASNAVTSTAFFDANSELRG